MKNKKSKFIAVAGNMGVGKSTLVQFLCKQFKGQPFYEPVNDNPYFAKFFLDMKKWAFHSQVYFLTHKFHIHQRIMEKSGLVVLDRTIYEDAEIFAKGLYQTKKMLKDDFDLYWSLYESICKSLRPPDILIYLTCSIETLKKRIINRGRLEEKSVPLSYLKRLQKDYDLWISKIDFCEVVTIKTDELDYLGDLIHRANIVNYLGKYLLN